MPISLASQGSYGAPKALEHTAIAYVDFVVSTITLHGLNYVSVIGTQLRQAQGDRPLRP